MTVLRRTNGEVVVVSSARASLFRILLALGLVLSVWPVSFLVVKALHAGSIPYLNELVLRNRDAYALSHYLERALLLRVQAQVVAVVGAVAIVAWNAPNWNAAVGRFAERAERWAFRGWALALSALLVAAYLPVRRALFPVHDYLDSVFVLNALRGRQPGFFDLDARLDGFMGGVPLSSLVTHDLDPFANLYVILEPTTAAVVTEIVSRGVAFLGMWLLLTKGLSPYARIRPLAAASASFFFALLPFWPGGIAPSVAFQPLFFYGFLEFRAGRAGIRSWCAVVAYPLVAGFVASGFAVLLLAACAPILDLARRDRHAAQRTLLPLSIVTMLFIAASIRPIHLVFGTDFISHRVDWATPSRLFFNEGSVARFASDAVSLLLRGQYHFASGQLAIPIAIIGLATFILLLRWRCSVSAESRRLSSALLLSLALIILVTVVSASEMSRLTAFGPNLPVPIQLGRVYSLLPMIWAAALAISVSLLAADVTVRASVAALLLALMVSVHAVSSFPALSARMSPSGTASNGFAQMSPTTHFRTADIEELARIAGIQPANTTIVSYGLDPMIGAFNGFKTLDGYHYNYSLDHKRAFREVIALELERTGRANYFDDWGSRAYLSFRPDFAEARVDFGAARRLGAQYVLASGRFTSPNALTEVAHHNGLVLYRIESE